jgi:hypothetical protein
MMEPLWSPVVATGGNRSQIAQPPERRKQAETVAVGCERLRPGPHGKEGTVRVRQRARNPCKSRFLVVNVESEVRRGSLGRLGMRRFAGISRRRAPAESRALRSRSHRRSRAPASGDRPPWVWTYRFASPSLRLRGEGGLAAPRTGSLRVSRASSVKNSRYLPRPATLRALRLGLLDSPV